MEPRGQKWRLRFLIAGLVPLALIGIGIRFVSFMKGRRLFLPGRKVPAVMVKVASWFTDLVLPGVTTLAPFKEYYYTVAGKKCPRTVQGGEEFSLSVTLKNLGTATWDGPDGSHPVRLGTWNPEDRQSPFFHSETWILPNRPAGLEESVPPGESGTFFMTFRAPAEEGRYLEELSPVADGRSWFPGQPVQFAIRVRGGKSG